jgi:hypothetical protein
MVASGMSATKRRAKPTSRCNCYTISRRHFFALTSFAQTLRRLWKLLPANAIESSKQVGGVLITNLFASQMNHLVEFIRRRFDVAAQTIPVGA